MKICFCEEGQNCNAKKQDSADRKARSIIILADEFCGRFERIAYYKRNMEQKIIT